MAKLTLSDISGGYLNIPTINANWALIEAALENTLSRDGTSPNTMSASLDMNSNRVINLAPPQADSDAARLVDLSDSDATGAAAATLRSELANTTSSGLGDALIGVKSTLTGATARTQHSKNLDVVSVKDFGATGDGTTDDTAAIQAAHDGLPAAGGTLLFPAGTYKVAATITFTKPTSLKGAGVGATIIKTSHATNNVISWDAAYMSITDVTFDTSVTRTSGSYLNITKNCSNSRLRDFYMNAPFYGITGSSINSIWFENGTIYDTSTTGTAIRLLDDATAPAGNDIYLNKLTLSAASNNANRTGILMTGVGAVNITDCDIIRHGTNLSLAPANGEVCTTIYIENTYFDSATYGAWLVPSVGGTLTNVRFTGCWFGSNAQYGVVLGSAGTLSGISFIDPHIFDNTVGGVLMDGGTDVRFVAGGICGHAGVNGVTIAANVSQFSFTNVRIGNGYSKSGNGTGISIAAGTGNNFGIIGCDLRGNTVAALSDSSTGATKRIHGNLGHITENSGTSSIASGTTSIAVTHGLSVTPAAKDIFVTFTENPTNDPGNIWISNPTSTQFTVNCRADPGASNLDFSWQARVL